MYEKTARLDSPQSFEIVAQKDDRVKIITLSGEEEMDTLSEEDMCMLTVLKNQLEKLLHSPEERTADGEYTATCLSRAICAFSLSEREGDVLRLVADGRSNSDISEQIHVSISTVKKHVYNIFNKAGVNSRTQLLNLVFGIRM